MKSYKHIKSLQIGLEILRFLSEQTELVSGGEVAKALDIPLDTCMRQLSTLEAAEFAARAGNLYELGQFAALLWARRKSILQERISEGARDLRPLEV